MKTSGEEFPSYWRCEEVTGLTHRGPEEDVEVRVRLRAQEDLRAGDAY
jgi:hypothetical protein